MALQAVNSCDMSSVTSRGGARGGTTSGEQLRYVPSSKRTVGNARGSLLVTDKTATLSEQGRS